MDKKWEDPTEKPHAERWHGDLLAMDPGAISPGLACFRHGVLVACTRLRVPAEFAELPEPERWIRIADLAVTWWIGTWDGITRTVRTFIYERPQWYTREKSKGDPNKLAHVLGVGQSLAVMLCMMNSAKGARQPELLAPTPAEWTGQVPKTVKRKGKDVLPKDPRESVRHSRVWFHLEPGEKAVCLARNEEGKLTDTLLSHINNDAFDGIGLGEFALGRYKIGATGRVFAGATKG